MSTQELIFLNYLSSVFENLDDAILLYEVRSSEFELLLVNKGFYTMTGYRKVSPEQLTKELHERLVGKSFTNDLHEVIQTKRIKESTTRIAVPRGDVVTKVKIIPILNSLGEVTHIVFIARDITELHAQANRIATLEAQNK